jgi:serine/threonine protein kinase
MSCFSHFFKRKTGPQRQDDPASDYFTGSENITRYSYRELVRATSNFDQANKIGEGGYGPVYKGTLKDGRAIAVKVLSLHSRQGAKEFLNELLAISDVAHENLVKLYGCCVEGNHRILVYNYLENNSLAHTLLGTFSLLNPRYYFLECYYFLKIKYLDAVTFSCLPCYRFRA